MCMEQEKESRPCFLLSSQIGSVASSLIASAKTAKHREKKE
jgi:hypothetical protein